MSSTAENGANEAWRASNTLAASSQAMVAASTVFSVVSTVSRSVNEDSRSRRRRPAELNHGAPDIPVAYPRAGLIRRGR
ncbi:hypothetical protein ACN27E_18670 [Mycobacterium sp. WMMD1722]|uniref:hypothetical protein n=1 Tax=Mycobacterium sp. WMMD1722 TaxID=3404117 RepID=UPI003BF4B27F